VALKTTQGQWNEPAFLGTEEDVTSVLTGVASVFTGVTSVLTGVASVLKGAPAPLTQIQTACLKLFPSVSGLPSFLLSFVVLRLKFRAYTLSYSTNPFFVTGFFEIRSLKLFAQAGFEPRSS
jgi:hypothetical protein